MSLTTARRPRTRTAEEAVGGAEAWGGRTQVHPGVVGGRGTRGGADL